MSSPRSSVWLPFGPVFSPLSSDATAVLIIPALRFLESRFARTDGSVRLPLSGVAPPRYHMLGINVSFGRLSSKIKHRRGFGSAGRPIEQFDDEIGRAHVELQSLMRISYAVFCLKKKKTHS